MRPLDRSPSIKLKLGVVILAAVAVTVAVVTVGVQRDWPVPVLAVGAGLLALGMVQVLARGMTSPLREMARAATAMAHGRYDERVTATSQDEVGDLARAFNDMARELAQVDLARRELIATVSHELRTPISALRAVLENLVDGVESPDRDRLDTMLRQAERLGRLVEQLLDLSRLEAGVVPLRRGHVALAGLLREVVATFDLADPDVRFLVDVEPEDLAVDGDAERLHQVVANLTDNAVRHSPPGGRVHLSARPSGGGVTVTVADEGPGIPVAAADRVFERFTRLGARPTGDDGGSGLGLAVVRWIVDLHGGEVAVGGDAGSGCRMVVHLPRRAT